VSQSPATRGRRRAGSRTAPAPEIKTASDAGTSEETALVLEEVVDEGASTPIESLDELQRRDKAQDIELKRTVATWTLRAVFTELIIANGVFISYCLGNHWRIPTSAIDIWLGATVVQIVGVLLVIVKYLFPTRSGD
jgi:hypothetical protein